MPYHSIHEWAGRAKQQLGDGVRRCARRKCTGLRKKARFETRVCCAGNLRSTRSSSSRNGQAGGIGDRPALSLACRYSTGAFRKSICSKRTGRSGARDRGNSTRERASFGASAPVPPSTDTRAVDPSSRTSSMPRLACLTKVLCTRHVGRPLLRVS